MADYKDVMPLLNGLWVDILSMYGIDTGSFKGLNTSNAPCPLCGGNDRAHWREQNGRVALFCRTCTGDSMKSPEDVIMESTGMSFNELVGNLADFVNHVPVESIKKAKLKARTAPSRNMPIDHAQDHDKVAEFLKLCEYAHSFVLLCKNAPNPQKLPTKGDVDYYPVSAESGVPINLVKIVNYEPKFLIEGKQSYGATYKINGGKRVIITDNYIDGILCWYKTRATIHITFTLENLRYCLRHRKDIKAVVCIRSDDLYDEFIEDGHEARLLKGDPYSDFTIHQK